MTRIIKKLLVSGYVISWYVISRFDDFAWYLHGKVFGCYARTYFLCLMGKPSDQHEFFGSSSTKLCVTFANGVRLLYFNDEIKLKTI